MPLSIQAAIVVASLAVVLVAVFLIGLILQFQRTGRAAEQLIEKLANDLYPIMDKVKETSQNMDRVVSQAAGGLEQARGFISALAELAETLRLTNRLLRGSGLRLLINTAGLVAGVKSGASYFVDRLRKER